MFNRLFWTLISLLGMLAASVAAQEGEFNMGEVITIEGEVVEILSPNSFVMARTEPFDFTPSNVIVFNDDTEPFAVDVNEGRVVQVTGTISALIYDDFTDDLGYEVDTTLYDEYDATDYAVVATQVVDSTALAPAGQYDYDEDFIAEVNQNPALYVGETFTAEGYVAEILGPYTFRLEGTTPFQFTPGEFLVMNDDTTPFDIDVNVGRRVRVTGQLYAFDFEDVNAITPYDLDPASFEFYDTGDFAMVATEVSAVSAIMPDTLGTVTDDEAQAVTSNATMDELEDNPLAYVGMTVSVEGEIEDIWTETSFLLEEDEFFDLDPMQIPVFAREPVNYPPDGTDPFAFDDELYLVTGEVIAFNLVDIENELGFDYDDTLYTAYDEEDIAIIASQVVLIEE